MIYNEVRINVRVKTYSRSHTHVRARTYCQSFGYVTINYYGWHNYTILIIDTYIITVIIIVIKRNQSFVLKYIFLHACKIVKLKQSVSDAI